MTREDILSLLSSHQEAFLARDAPRLALQHTPAGTFQSPAHGIVEGRRCRRVPLLVHRVSRSAADVGASRRRRQSGGRVLELLRHGARAVFWGGRRRDAHRDAGRGGVHLRRRADYFRAARLRFFGRADARRRAEGEARGIDEFAGTGYSSEWRHEGVVDVRRQFVGVGEEQAHLPHLVGGERAIESWHPSQADAVGHFPVRSRPAESSVTPLPLNSDGRVWETHPLRWPSVPPRAIRGRPRNASDTCAPRPCKPQGVALMGTETGASFAMRA